MRPGGLPLRLRLRLRLPPPASPPPPLPPPPPPLPAPRAAPAAGPPLLLKRGRAAGAGLHVRTEWPGVRGRLSTPGRPRRGPGRGGGASEGCNRGLAAARTRAELWRGPGASRLLREVAATAGRRRSHGDADRAHAWRRRSADVRR